MYVGRDTISFFDKIFQYNQKKLLPTCILLEISHKTPWNTNTRRPETDHVEILQLQVDTYLLLLDIRTLILLLTSSSRAKFPPHHHRGQQNGVK